MSGRTRTIACAFAVLALTACTGSDATPDSGESSAATSVPTSVLASGYGTGPTSMSSSGSSGAPSTSGRGRSDAPADVAQRSGTRASVLLGTLAVKGRAPRTGYDRALFGSPWSDDTTSPLGHNGCDTRNDVLGRDLAGVRFKPGTRNCLVLSGTLADPYTGRTLAFSRATDAAAVQIDHVVALSDAWQTGAQQWDADTRAAFANDPLNLLAVDGPTNQGKGDGDAATWLPPNKAYRCAYVARQVAVKARYRLWVTAAERAAIGRVLATCPTRTAPTETAPASIGRGTPTPSSSAATGCARTASGRCIQGGQACRKVLFGQLGTDGEGRTYRCTGDPSRPHWQLP